MRLLPLLAFFLSCLNATALTDLSFPLPLTRGTERIHHFLPEKGVPTARIVFASGDGGWTDWEITLAEMLAKRGWEVLGLNSRTYAATDYDAKTLTNDFTTIAESKSYDASLPLFYGGWSMGAVQCVAAAGTPTRPTNLAGLLVLSADSRGRYGLRTSDELAVTPTGPGTFALRDFSDMVDNLRVAQIHGGADFMSSTAWGRSLPSSALYEMPGANHGFDGPSPDFTPILAQTMKWLSGDNKAAPPADTAQLPWGLSPLWPGSLAVLLITFFFIFSRKHSLAILAVLITLMGALNLLEAVMVKSPAVVDWMQQWLPLGVSEKSRTLLIFSGLILVGLGRGIFRRKRTAWVIATGMLAFTAVLHLARALDWHHSLAAVLLLVPLVRWRKFFVARTDSPSVKLALMAAPLTILSLLAYGITTIRHQSEIGAFGEAIPWSRIFAIASAAIVGIRPESSQFADPHLHRIFDLLGISGALAALILLYFLLRPVLARRYPSHVPEETERVKSLLESFGDDPSDPYQLLPDKRYHFQEGLEGFVGYAMWRDFAVALGDPVSASADKEALVKSFTLFCRKNDWVPLFYNTAADYRAIYETCGLVTFKVGEDARIPLSTFSLAGGKFQNLRTARSKALKEGLSFRWYDAAAGIDHGLESQLKIVSDEWLSSKQGSEMGFDLGSFSLEAIREEGCAVILNGEGRVNCFATWHPYAQGKRRALDLMRTRRDVRGVMDFLILECIDHFKELGVSEVSLGNAPLANTETDPSRLSRPERRVKLIFDHFDRFYGYKSLYDFKRKYQPDWQGRYLAYPAGTMLTRIALAIAAIHFPKGLRGILKS